MDHFPSFNCTFGYKNERDASGKAIIIIEEDKAEIVQEIFRWYLKGVPHWSDIKGSKKNWVYQDQEQCNTGTSAELCLCWHDKNSCCS